MPGTVTVGCKIPSGLHLRLYTMVEKDIFVNGTVYKTKEAVPDDRRYKINGCARYVGADSPHDIRHGVGLTHGVDKDFFEEWLKRNASMEVVRDKLIFAHEKPVEVEAQAKDRKSLKTGLEPLERADSNIRDPRLPTDLRKIKTADKPA